MNDALQNPQFSSGLNSEHKQVYLKLLRESIIDELKLTDSVTRFDL